MGLLGGLLGAAAAARSATDLRASRRWKGWNDVLRPLIAGGFYRGARSGRAGSGACIRSTALFSVALTRPGPLHIALVHAGLLLSLRPAAVLASSAAAARCARARAIVAWRPHVYGYPFPNTFYAKTGGLPVLRPVCRGPCDQPPVRARPGALSRGRSSRWTMPAAALLVGQIVYVVAVGGDFKPTGRFLIVALVPLALLASEAAAGLSRTRMPIVRWLTLAGFPAALVVGTLRMHQEVRGWAGYRHEDFMARRVVGEYLGRAFPPDTLIAIHSAGCIPYYSGLPTIDMWGLTDAHIARAPAPELGTGMAGHERGDPAYVFGRNPALYLPEDHLLTLQPHELEPGPGFPEDFETRYRAADSVEGGRNLWVGKASSPAQRGGR